MDAPDLERTLKIGSMPLSVYGAMFAATVAGDFVGIFGDAALGLRGRAALVLPMALSVVFEAAAGERAARTFAGVRLDAPSAAARVSVTYSLLLVALSIPIAAWIVGTQMTATQSGRAGGESLRAAALLVGVTVALALMTAARAGLIRALSRRGA